MCVQSWKTWGTPTYYQHTLYDLLAVIHQLGVCTGIFNLSEANLKWPDMIQIIARQYGASYTDEEVAALSFEDKSNWLKRNPVTATRYFHYRVNTLFEFLKISAKPLGEVVDFGIRIEFQARGSLASCPGPIHSYWHVGGKSLVKWVFKSLTSGVLVVPIRLHAVQNHVDMWHLMPWQKRSKVLKSGVCHC